MPIERNETGQTRIHCEDTFHTPPADRVKEPTEAEHEPAA
jgi:hypothetical protein